MEEEGNQPTPESEQHEYDAGAAETRERRHKQRQEKNNQNVNVSATELSTFVLCRDLFLLRYGYIYTCFFVATFARTYSPKNTTARPTPSSSAMALLTAQAAARMPSSPSSS